MPLPGNLALTGRVVAALDGEGSLWLTGANLVRLPMLGLVRNHVDPERQETMDVKKPFRDRLGQLWTARSDGLFRRDVAVPGWRRVPESVRPRQLVQASDGGIYFRDSDRLKRVDLKTLRARTVNLPLLGPDQKLLSGPISHGDRMWLLGAEGRLVAGRWRGGLWAWEMEPSPASVNARNDLWMDEQGRPWMAVSNRLFCRSVAGWEEVPLPAGIKGVIAISSISPDAAVAVQYQPPQVLALTRSSQGWSARSLLDQEALKGIGALYSVRMGAKGLLWLGSERGVLRIRSGSPVQITRLGTSQGLPDDDTNSGGLILETDGRLLVGTIRGLSEIDTRQEQAMELLAASAKPTILEARCGDWISPGAVPQLTKRHNQGAVLWELGFPGAMRGEWAHFEFREAGGAWTKVAGTALQFPEVSPGNHTYEVRMVPFLGSPGPALDLQIHALPPWYRHPVAYGVWMLILLGSVYGGFRWRLALLERRNQHLQKAVDMATADLNATQEDLKGLNRRLYELNDAKNRVIGLAAHDLRNPLTSILLYCEMMSEDPPTPKVGKQVGAIKTLGTTMADLIKRLLDVHAIEAGRAEAPRIASMDLTASLAKAISRAANAAGRKHIQLDFKEAPPMEVLADVTHVGQILDNYLSNALKYSPSDTTVTVSLTGEETQVRVLIKDQGPGLTAEDLGRAFGEYARLSARPTAGEASVGLGLSLVKRMAEAMGGAVGVESVHGEGATFWLALPKPTLEPAPGGP